MEKIRIGVSACLTGQKVRYDGGHALDRYITETLGRYFELAPVCPEAEAGLGVPREPMRLVGDVSSPRLITVNTKRDLTEILLSWSESKLRELKDLNLCGFIFKSKSPSSGMERVKVYKGSGPPVKKGIGLFARAFMERFPLIPVEEDGRLHDPDLRENFLERVFTFSRWQEMLKGKGGADALVDFHTSHKYLILSHSPSHYKVMGRLVAGAGNLDQGAIRNAYGENLMKALSLKATPKKHANVLQHMMGYFKEYLTGDEKQELLELIEAYRSGLVPLIVPITLINHYVRKYQQPYLMGQLYLRPHPLELKLRNHA